MPPPRAMTPKFAEATRSSAPGSRDAGRVGSTLEPGYSNGGEGAFVVDWLSISEGERAPRSRLRTESTASRGNMLLVDRVSSPEQAPSKYRSVMARHACPPCNRCRRVACPTLSPLRPARALLFFDQCEDCESSDDLPNRVSRTRGGTYDQEFIQYICHRDNSQHPPRCTTFSHDGNLEHEMRIRNSLLRIR